jgi:hypothetical protein
MPRVPHEVTSSRIFDSILQFLKFSLGNCNLLSTVQICASSFISGCEYTPKSTQLTIFINMSASPIYLGVVGRISLRDLKLHAFSMEFTLIPSSRRRRCWHCIPLPACPPPQCSQARPPRSFFADSPRSDTGLLTGHSRGRLGNRRGGPFSDQDWCPARRGDC